VWCSHFFRSIHANSCAPVLTVTDAVLLLGEARVARLIDEGDCRGAAPPDPLYLLR
jgi:hypothetical protein